MIRAILICFLTIAVVPVSYAQEDPFLERHALIDSLYSLEEYERLIDLIELQIEEIDGTTWQDSIYLYAYSYGRAHWKVNGIEAGVIASKGICDQVILNSPNAEHKFQALSDLSWLYYEVGDLNECLRVDSTALVVALTEEVPEELRGRAYQYMGFDYSMLGQYKKAAKHFASAVEVFEHIEPPLKMRLAEAYNGVGASHWHMGRNRDAEQYYLKSLYWLEGENDPDMISRRASALGNLAILWEDAGDLMKSKAYYQQNLELNGQVIATSEDPFVRDEAMLNRANTYSNIAALYYSIGDYATTKSFLDLSYADRSSVYEADNPKLLVLKDRYADVELASGNYEKAESLQREYLVACERVYGTESEFTAHTKSKLGKIAAAQGRWDEAERFFAESIEIQRSIGTGEADPIVALAYLERAQMYMEMEQREKSMQDLRSALAMYSISLGDSSRKVANCHLLISENALASDEIVLAEAHIDSALAILELDHRSTDLPSSHLQPHVLPQAIHHNVVVQRHAGKGNKESQLHELDRAIALMDRNKTALQDEESQLLFLGAQKKVFELAQLISYELYEESQEGPWMDKAFSLTEENKSVLLKSRLNNFAGISFGGVPDSIVEKENQLLSELTSDPSERGSMESLMGNEKAFNDLLKELRHEYPRYFELKYGKSEISIYDVQKELLQDGQSLIAYSFAGDHLYTFLIEKKKATMHRIEDPGIASMVADLNAAIAGMNNDAYAEYAYALFKLLIEPIKDELTNSELLIIPDEELYFLNFELLQSNSGPSGEMLIKDHTISYLISANTAVQFSRLDKKKAEGVVAFAPGFSDEMRSEYLASTDSTLVDQDYLRYVQQPFAVEAAKELGTVFSANVMLGSDANEPNFHETASKHGIIHLGTHAEMNNTSPLYSKLVLGKGGDSTNIADGYLHAYEIYKMELNAELAVLTACETGVGEQNSSEGVRSLAHSFAYAGCPSLVMSLWKIDEKTSNQIITYFYENLADGQPKNAALRNAKLRYLETAEGELASPFYWAGVVLVGDPSPVDLGGGSIPMWVYLVATVVLILIVRGIVQKRNKKPRE